MEEKKSIKISLSTFFLIIALIIIIIMGCYIYIEKSNSNKKISDLEENANNMKNTINDLQETINTVRNTVNSNTNSNVSNNIVSNNNTVSNNNMVSNNNVSNNSENISVDYTISIEDLEVIDSNNNQELENFFNKYAGKKVKVEGYVSNYGDDAIVPTSTQLATYINIGNSKTYKDKIYAGGYTFNSNVIKKIKNAKIGQKVTIIGTVVNGTWPLDLEDIIIEY